VPAGYDRDTRRRYPVLYLNDGQNLFDSSTSVLNPMEWRVDEVANALIDSGRIGPVIIVGMDNAGRRGRFKEYFPWVDEYLQPPEPDPQGRLYPEFVVDEVMPFINAHYRTRTGPAYTGIGGSSAGALAALYAVATRPGVFGQLLVESPSIYVDNDHILRDLAQLGTWPGRIFLGVGTNESNRAECDPGAPEGGLARVMRDFERMVRRQAPASRVQLVVVPCGRHDEAAWAARLPTALRFLYGT
jgi:predicted alpha/beta superfamily hydrolase